MSKSAGGRGARVVTWRQLSKAHRWPALAPTPTNTPAGAGFAAADRNHRPGQQPGQQVHPCNELCSLPAAQPRRCRTRQLSPPTHPRTLTPLPAQVPQRQPSPPWISLLQMLQVQEKAGACAQGLGFRVWSFGATRGSERSADGMVGWLVAGQPTREHPEKQGKGGQQASSAALAPSSACQLSMPTQHESSTLRSAWQPA